jgi:hypothetical protein
MKKSLSLLFFLYGSCLLTGCGGNATTPPPTQAIIVDLSLNSAQALDVNQSIPVTANVSNDSSSQGVTWTVICTAGVNACGAMAQTKSASGTQNKFVAPGSVSASETVTVTATSVSDSSKSKSVSVTVNPALSFVASPPMQAQFAAVGQSFSFNLANFIQGGTQPFKWAVTSGTLPAGLKLDAGTGIVSGVPSAASAASLITLNCTDTGMPPITLPSDLQISLAVSAAGVLTITSGAPPNGSVGVAYGGSQVVQGLAFTGFPLTAAGGTPPYSWSWAAPQGSSIPPGLQVILRHSGGSTRCCVDVLVIGGTPTQAGTYKTILTVTDSAATAGKASANYTIVISGSQSSSLAITSGAPPSGTAGMAYDDTVVTVPCTPGTRGCICHDNVCVRIVSGTNGFPVTASGGTQAYTWSWASAVGSSLPVGLNIDSNTGIISGDPRTAGSFNVVVSVTDSSSPPEQASANYALLIEPPAGSPPTPAITTTSVPMTFAVNLANHGFAFTATDGVPPYAWSETGPLPPGLAFSDGGVLYGTPTAAGTFPITLTVRDSTGQDSAPVDFKIPVSPHGFAATGSMGTVRELHTATLLDSGKVLITGGDDETGDSSAKAELFDPSTGFFAPTGSMGNVRSNHTATLLCNLSSAICKDNRVLVTGGGTVIAELFDPSTGSFTATGSMETIRFAATATLLNSGNVLVAGGVGPLDTAELYNPAAGTFTPVGNMSTGRSNHTAVLLSSGKVLLIGGRGVNGISVGTAELFDPSNATFTPTGKMATPRSGHTAMLLCNLSSPPCADNRVLVTGGVDATGAPVSTAEIFDPNAGSFTPVGGMTVARALHTATLLRDGTVLIAGPDQTAELFDPQSGTFAATGSMTAARASHTATLMVNGKVLITGGNDVNINSTVVALGTAELYQ